MRTFFVNVLLGVAITMVVALGMVALDRACLAQNAALGISNQVTPIAYAARVAYPASIAVAGTTVDDRKPLTPEQQITTEVVDPRRPDEPWTVTTYRRLDESEEAFVTRHLRLVEAVRRALGT